jgi:hypothetical protein
MREREPWGAGPGLSKRLDRKIEESADRRSATRRWERARKAKAWGESVEEFDQRNKEEGAWVWVICLGLALALLGGIVWGIVALVQTVFG